jgi:hypothetical protein
MVILNLQDLATYRQICKFVCDTPYCAVISYCKAKVHMLPVCCPVARNGICTRDANVGVLPIRVSVARIEFSCDTLIHEKHIVKFASEYLC